LLESFVLAVVVADEVSARWLSEQAIANPPVPAASPNKTKSSYVSHYLSECSISQKFYLGRDNKLLGTVQDLSHARYERLINVIFLQRNCKNTDKY